MTVVQYFETASSRNRKSAILVVARAIGDGSRPLFSVAVGGRIIVTSTATPAYAAARQLLAEFTDPDTVLVIRHVGGAIADVRTTIAAAAGLTAQEPTQPASKRHRAWRAEA